MRISPFDIVVVRFAFEEDPTIAKPRPAVVLAIEGDRVGILVAKVTSHAPRREWPGEVGLADWEAEGLARPSVVRCSKILHIAESDIKCIIGHLSTGDRIRVEEGIIAAGK